MKQKLLKRVSLFVSSIIQVIGTFILTIFFLIKYFVHLIWESIVTIASHDDDKDDTRTERSKENHEDIFKFSYVWKLLEHQTAKQVTRTVLTQAKDMAHRTNRKFWLDMEKIIPFFLAIVVMFFLFIGAAILGIINVVSAWTLVLIGAILYFVFLFWIRSLFKKFLK